MRKYLIILLFFLQGCSPFFGDKKIERRCFNTFEREVYPIFDLREQDSLQIRLIDEKGSDHDFYLNNKFIGYIVPLYGSYSTNRILEKNATIAFTGTVIKTSPNWAEYHIGGGRKSVSLEVLFEKRKYIIFGFYMPKEFIKRLPERCSFKFAKSA